MESASTDPQPSPAQGAVLQMAMGAMVTKVLTEATKLGIPDLVKDHGSLSASEMVSCHGVAVDLDSLERVLRACASAGIFTEDHVGKFGPTELSETLTASSPASLKKLVEAMGGTWYKGWTMLGEAIRTGRPQSNNVFGAEWWDFLNANPKELEDFGAAMKSASHNSLRGVLERYDFTGVASIADIAGGFGHMAVGLVEKYSALQATVLDVPSVIRLATEQLAALDPSTKSRLEYVGGDMFESVPQAEAYIMKHIIHDWDDERCVQLLENCRRSMQGNGRVLCIDTVVQPMGSTSDLPAKLVDILMMVVLPGRERTEAQWRRLYDNAGFKVQRIIPLQDNIGTSIVEGIKKES
jgi:ubiquinone/menaquinone biosynthesis C-methylase UbiE